MPEPTKKSIEEIFADGTAIDRALQRGAQRALWLHKRLGYPIATWRDGQVVWIPAEEIVVDEPPPLPSLKS